MDFNKNIILIHDQENCNFPSRDVLEPDMQQIFDIRAIPYIREYRKIIFTNILSSIITVDLIKTYLNNKEYDKAHDVCLKPFIKITVTQSII